MFSSVCIITQLLIQFGFGIIYQFNFEHCLEYFWCVSVISGICQRLLDVFFMNCLRIDISYFCSTKSLKTELIPNNLLFITESFCDFLSPPFLKCLKTGARWHDESSTISNEIKTPCWQMGPYPQNSPNLHRVSVNTQRNWHFCSF